MTISGVLVHARPDSLETVQAAIQSLPGTEVHARTPAGRLVVTIEQAGTEQLSGCVLGMHDIQGVLSVSLIYHEFEEDHIEELAE